MTKNIHKLFKNLKDVEPTAGLEGKVLRQIALEKNWQAKKKLIFADVLVLGSLGAFVFALLNWGSSLMNSEFWSLAKLMFTDAGTVVSHWMNFSFSLLETFPAAHLAAVLAPVFLLMVSLNMYFANKNNKYNHIT
jgi:hypothetical protein